MKTIWKYKISPEMKLEIPKGAIVLSIQTQGDQPCMWVLVDSFNENELRKFKVYGTGHQLPENPGKYIGTFQVENGSLVFHLFEE